MERDENLDYFTALNDDCILELFHRLPLSDLCAVSTTCKKLKKLAGEHFHRKYPRLVAKKIAIGKNRSVDYECFRISEYSGQYANYFSQQIENVGIYSDKYNTQLVEFMQTKCSKRIKTILFMCTRWDETFRTLMRKSVCAQKIFKNIVTAHFVYPNFLHKEDQKSLYLGDILDYCTQIKCLKVQDFYALHSLPSKSIPSLEALEYHISNRYAPDFEHLATYLQRSPNIKRLTCNVDFANAAKRLFAIVRETSSIEELFIQFNFIWSNDFELILDDLKTLNECEHLKRIECCVIRRYNVDNTKMLEILSALTKLCGIHLIRMRNVNQWVEPLQLIVNLKTLSFNGCQFPKETASDLARNLPNLEQLRIWNEHLNIGERWKATFDDCVKPFVRFSKKMRNIFIETDSIFKDEYYDILELNEERKKLKGAHKLTICLQENDDAAGGSYEKSSELVNIKRVLEEIPFGSALNMFVSVAHTI